MSPRTIVVSGFAACCSLLLFALPADKSIATATGENDDLILNVTLHLDPSDIKSLVTSDLGGHFVLAEVKVEPKYGKSITVTRDDFVLADTDHNDKSKPFAANQIAGPALVIKRGPDDDDDDKGKDTAKGKSKKKNRPTFSGGPLMTSPGVTLAPTLDPSKAKAHDDAGEKDTPLEKDLSARMLPEGATEKPAVGLLFFALEKVKMKDLQLTYGPKETRIVLRFK